MENSFLIKVEFLFYREFRLLKINFLLTSLRDFKEDKNNNFCDSCHDVRSFRGGLKSRGQG